MDTWYIIDIFFFFCLFDYTFESKLINHLDGTKFDEWMSRRTTSWQLFLRYEYSYMISLFGLITLLAAEEPTLSTHLRKKLVAWLLGFDLTTTAATKSPTIYGQLA